MILKCYSERGRASRDDVLPTGTPVTTAEAKCPRCGEWVTSTFVGHLPKPPKRIQHNCTEDRYGSD